MTATPSEISKEFNSVGVRERLEFLLDYSENLPDLPERYQNQPELFEKVEECQSPVFLFVEVNHGRVSLFITAPQEAPTTRGFAGILREIIHGASIVDALAVDEEFVNSLGLAQAVSPLRMRGMRAMLFRIKRQIQEKSSE